MEAETKDGERRRERVQGRAIKKRQTQREINDIKKQGMK